MNEPTHITSRDNAWFKELKKLSLSANQYRTQQRFWAEGDHLVRAALGRGVTPEFGIFSESFWPLAQAEYGSLATKNIVITDAMFDAVSALPSPTKMGFVFALPVAPVLQTQAATVVLDRLQDAGNVGAILRSASAFGFTQVLALKGTAALWSPKVLRAGMGAHWGLHLIEGLAPEDLIALAVPWLVTSSHRGDFLHQMLQKQTLPMPCAWVMGHEGQGVSPLMEARAHMHVRIAQPGGEESLNVAIAAAICLHASATSTLD